MILDYAFLAERASRLDDGRLVVFGGDIDAIEAAKLPVLFQTTLVAKMLLEEGESPVGHYVELAYTSPSRNRTVIVKNEGLDAPPVGSEVFMRAGAGLIATLQILLKEPGIYNLHLSVDGKELKTMPLFIHSKRNNESEVSHDENSVAHAH